MKTKMIDTFNKNIKHNTMKTRFISMTLVQLFAVATIAGASDIKIINSSAASCHENATEPDSQEMVSDNTLNVSTMLDEWIATREIWEQESQEIVSDNVLNESSVLNEWIATREIWEQESQEMVSDNAPNELFMLNEWIDARENWEQK
jgi:hypothetical protein